MTDQKITRTPIFWLILAFLVGVAGILFACSGAPAAPALSTLVPCPTVVSNPTPVSFDDLWKSSAHADAKALAFTHWNNTTPPLIPTSCAECHSRPGFIDFLGVDGSTPGKVDQPAAVGTTLTCFVCHNEATSTMDNVTFPSGNTAISLGVNAGCVTCHAGSTSGGSISDAITKAALASDDTPSASLTFISAHSISGATSFGSEAHGAFEYPGRTYQGRYIRGGVFFTCTQCHDPHTLAVKVDSCNECHTFAGGDVKNIRVNTTDFAGDGNLTEGVSVEIAHLQADLYTAMQAYAKNTAGTALVYDGHTYPYFFIDTNGNGKLDASEANPKNQYNAWTPRLLRAAYNYSYVSDDPGAFAHNSTYVIQVLYDSIADLGGNTSGLTRP